MKRRGNRARNIIAVICTAAVSVMFVATSRIHASDQPVGPTRDTRIGLAKPSGNATTDVESAWHAPAGGGFGPRGVPPIGTMLYDNGMPLPDVADTATQFSLAGLAMDTKWHALR